LPTEHEEEIVHDIKDGDSEQTREKTCKQKKKHSFKKNYNKTWLYTRDNPNFIFQQVTCCDRQ